MGNKDWDAYWDEDNLAFDEIMHITTNAFYNKLRKRFPIYHDDIILDYGCGPGILITHLKNECKEIVGIDISSAYIKKCNELFKETEHVTVFKISDLNDLEKISASKNINKVIVHSVIQYFESKKYLIDFLEIFRKISKEENREVHILIADIIPQNHFICIDFFDVLFDALRRKYLFKYILFLFRYTNKILFNNNRKILKVDYQFFEQYAAQHNIEASKIENLTNHRSRYSIELVFT